MKTLINSDGNGVQKNVPDVQFWGNPDGFSLICKASSQKEGWMKSTKAMEIPGVGCLVQVTRQQKSVDGNSYALAEALAFVPGVTIETDAEPGGIITGRRLIALDNQKSKKIAWGEDLSDVDGEVDEYVPGIREYKGPFHD